MSRAASTFRPGVLTLQQCSFPRQEERVFSKPMPHREEKKHGTATECDRTTGREPLL